MRAITHARVSARHCATGNATRLCQHTCRNNHECRLYDQRRNTNRFAPIVYGQLRQAHRAADNVHHKRATCDKNAQCPAPTLIAPDAICCHRCAEGVQYEQDALVRGIAVAAWCVYRMDEAGDDDKCDAGPRYHRRSSARRCRRYGGCRALCQNGPRFPCAPDSLRYGHTTVLPRNENIGSRFGISPPVVARGAVASVHSAGNLSRLLAYSHHALRQFSGWRGILTHDGTEVVRW